MSELRQDLVSGDWVLMAPERAGRPHDLFKKKEPRKAASKKNCPFENPQKTGNWPPILSYPAHANGKNWQIVLVQNKYPALVHDGMCAEIFKHGPYTLKTGIGAHDLIITRDHNKNFADLSPELATRLLLLLQERHKMIAKDECVTYVSSFFNWGSSAGASIWHPHYQVLALPVIPPGIKKSLFGGERYFKEHRRCVRCVMIRNDKKEKKRVIEENKFAIAVAPFASKEPFEIRILPKKHRPYFAKTPLVELRAVALLLQSVLRRVKKNLRDPDFNFFIHGAPLDYKKYRYHHWHIEVIPKISIIGGFELSTGIDINVVDPERAAEILRDNN